ncbi:MAG: VWA domain-containing protein [Bacteroidales bacterium]|nr:VWA domain-containing protein [Bacteroidales bacterium]
MSILTETSLWFIPVCVLLGVAYAFFLYFRNHETDYDRRAQWVMALLRGLAVSLIAFLLLTPMLKHSVKEVDKPMLVVAIDNSESMVSTSDSNYYRKSLQQDINKIINNFGDQYEVKTYLIGEKNELQDKGQVERLAFDAKTTNLSSIFEEISNLYANHNVGAMLLVSDGIFNTGNNPQYAAEKVKFPVYAVGTGDTTVQTDLLIADVLHNRQTYVGNYSPVEIKISATHLAGKKAKLTVYEGDEEIYTKPVDIRGNQHFETVKFTVEAKKKGMRKYRAELTELEGEITYKNNATSFFIEVIDQREKIAIVYHAPHPDVAAIRSALETSDKYDVEVFQAEEFNGNVNDYSLFVLHQLPSKTRAAGNLLNRINQAKISTLYVVGSQTDLSTLNQMNTGLSIQNISQGGRTMYNEAMPSVNESFLSFTFSEEARQMLKSYPPLTTFFANYQPAVSTSVFMYQKINNVVSNYPLITFYQGPTARVGVVAGTDLWRWRMQNYLKAQNFEAFDEIVNKMALYLSVKGDQGHFRVHAAELYSENSPVEISAEVYNESQELVNTPDVRFVLTDSEGKEFASQFSKQNNAYSLNLGKLPVGDYTWTATATEGSATYTKSGHFSVQEILLESMNLVANHDLMRTIANRTNGRYFSVSQLSQVKKAIRDNENIRPVVTYHKKYNPLLDSWIYLLAIVLLLGVEWFMRKWGGGY